MQKILSIFFSLAWLISCGQESPDKSAGSSDKKKEQFESKYVRLIEDTSKMMLIENVRINYGDLYVESDSALLDKPNKAVTAFGIKNIKFKGKEVEKKDYRNSVSYKLGSSRFFTN